MSKEKKSNKWGAAKKRRASIARVDAFDKSKQKVTEIENCRYLVAQLSSEVLPERERAVVELVRAGIYAIPFLPEIARLMNHNHWTQRLTGVEAIGSIALAEPTCDKLAQSLERLRFTFN